MLAARKQHHRQKWTLFGNEAEKVEIDVIRNQRLLRTRVDKLALRQQVQVFVLWLLSVCGLTTTSVVRRSTATRTPSSSSSFFSLHPFIFINEFLHFLLFCRNQRQLIYIWNNINICSACGPRPRCLKMNISFSATFAFNTREMKCLMYATKNKIKKTSAQCCTFPPPSVLSYPKFCSSASDTLILTVCWFLVNFTWPCYISPCRQRGRLPCTLNTCSVWVRRFQTFQSHSELTPSGRAWQSSSAVWSRAALPRRSHGKSPSSEKYVSYSPAATRWEPAAWWKIRRRPAAWTRCMSFRISALILLVFSPGTKMASYWPAPTNRGTSAVDKDLVSTYWRSDGRTRYIYTEGMNKNRIWNW